MFTVTGHIDGVPYGVDVGVEATDDTPERFGVAYGSPNAIAAVRTLDGTPVLATPTGPELVVSRIDPASILAALMFATTVGDVSGDEMPSFAVPGPGLIY